MECCYSYLGALILVDIFGLFSDHQHTKGPVMSTHRESASATHPSNNHLESSVDPPLANNEELFSLIHQVHESVPLRDNVPVPNSLSVSMREHPFRLQWKDFDKFYRIQDAVPSVESGEVSRAELVIMYLRSFHNILTYDLSSVEEFQERIIRHMGTVLADVLQLCYPTFGGTQLVGGTVVGISIGTQR